MFRITPHELSRRALLGLLPCLFGGLVFAGSAHAHSPSAAAAAAPKAYRVINLRAGVLTGHSSFNARDQIALSIQGDDGFSRAYFYDGSSLRDIGTLGGARALAFGLNDAGEVAGYSSLPGEALSHAFKWSRQGGMRDLGSLATPGISLAGTGTPINARGQVVGSSVTQTSGGHAFLWSPAEGMRDLGTLAGGGADFSFAEAINNAGMVVGRSRVTASDSHAFLWTHRTGMIDLGTLGGDGSSARGITEDGMVVGSATAADNLARIFTWTRRDGMRNAGTAGGIASLIAEKPLSRNGHNVAGTILITNLIRHAALWTRSTGLRDIGGLGGPTASSLGVNDKVQVVGVADLTLADQVGFIWTARDGMIDLNTRLRNAPPDLRVLQALAISNTGVILARSNAGMVLLKPYCSCAGPHTVGPIRAAGIVTVGALVDASLGFADDGKAQNGGYHVHWSWGDGSGEQQGSVRHSKGVGSADASYRYAAPGVHTVSARIGDRSGQGSTVSRTIVVLDPAAGTAGGSGWFASPAGANRKDQGQSGRATFAFFAPAGARAATPATLRFQAGSLNFHSERLAGVATQGGKQQFEGSGTVNGTGDYRFRLSVAAGPGQAQRIGLKIWHTDAVTGAELVDYDNLGADGGSVVPAAQGNIVLR